MTEVTEVSEVETEVETKVETEVGELQGGSVTDAYAGNHAEIRRRQALVESDNQNPRFFERADDAAAPAFRNDAQTHFVWSASHEGMAPCAKDAQHPAVRIYGLFPSHEEALEHAHVVAALDATCSLMISPTHEWTMLPRAPERLSEASGHVQAVLGAYAEQRDKSKREFEENVAQRRAGRGKREDATKPTDIAPVSGVSDSSSAPRRLGRDAEVRDQSLVAVSIVRDTTQAVGEPVFKVYAAFPTTAEGDAWARVAGDTVVDYDIDLVSTCSWLFINDVETSKIEKEVFRSQELTSIISHQKKQPQMCENFRKWRDESESES